MLTIEQIKATGIPSNVSRVNNIRYTPAALYNGVVNLYESIALVIEELVSSGTGTDLNSTADSSSVSITSSTGLDTSIPAATTTVAGVMSGTDKTNLNNIVTLTGVSAAANLGTFTGTTIADNSTIKVALQALETAVEGATLGGIYSGNGTIPNNTVADLTASGLFSIEYSNNNAALYFNDALNTTIISSRDGEQAIGLDNTSILFASGTSSMDYRDGVLKLYDSDNSHYVGLQTAPSAGFTTSYTLTLPNTDGNANQVLQTDGSGTLNWYSIPSTIPVSATITGTAVTLSDNGLYVFTGSTATWTLPSTIAGKAYWIKNRGSGNITLNSNGGASDIYVNSPVNSTIISAGSSMILICDGTYYNSI